MVPLFPDRYNKKLQPCVGPIWAAKINSSWWLNLRTILKAERYMRMEVLGLLSASPKSEFRQIWILITFPVPN